MKAALILAAAVALAEPAGAQQPKVIRARRCPAVDSLALPKNRFAGSVRTSYRKDADQTHFLTGTIVGRMRVMAAATVEGKTWTGGVPLELSVFIRGAEVSVVQTDPPPHRMSLVLDNVTELDLGPVAVGRWEGPENITPTIPLTVLLSPDKTLPFVRAKNAVIRIGKVDVAVDPGEQRDIASLYIVLACGSR